MKNLLFIILLFVRCAHSNLAEEKPFSFIGTWSYTYKVYLFEDSPMQLQTKGKGCNANVQCEFTPTRFILKLFQDKACSEAAQVELAYTITQENDSVFRLNSDQILRSNYIPNGQHNTSDFPFFEDGIQLILRSQNRFITYLSLPDEPTIAGRTYQAVYIEYGRVQ